MTPKIRIDGFTEDWQKFTLGKTGEFRSSGVDKKIDPNEKIINLLNYMDVYNMRKIDASNCSYLMQVSASDKQIKECTVEKNDIFFTPTSETAEDIGHVMVIEETLPNTCYSYHLMRFRPKTGFYSPLFPNWGFQTAFVRKQMYLAAKGVQRMVLGRPEFESLEIMAPSVTEQRLIASYFSSLDSMVVTAEKKIASLRQIKLANLQSMFPQEGESSPRVRFSGFNGDWIERELNDVLTERHEASTITEELPQLSFTIAEGVIRPEDRKSNKRDFLIKDKDNKRYLVTRVGDIIYNPANVVYGAIHRNSLCDGVVSPIYRIFTTTQDSIFMECVVRRPIFINKLAMRTEGTVKKLKTLKPEAFLEMKVRIPSDIAEQQKIAAYFRSLDEQIHLQTQRLEKLRQIKAACLDNMFV